VRRNVIILILVLIVFAVAYFFLVFQPQGTKIEDARLAADAMEQREQELELELRRLESLKAQAPELQAKLQKLDSAIPTNDPQLAQFILLVEEAANTSGIEWLSIAPSVPTAPQGDPNTLEVNISMSVTGGYFQVQDFLVRLENLSRAVKISTISLSPEELPALSVSMSMKMFLSNAPQPVATPAPVGG
jgi:Tfp pilus assembly protein PilO